MLEDPELYTEQQNVSIFPPDIAHRRLKQHLNLQNLGKLLKNHLETLRQKNIESMKLSFPYLSKPTEGVVRKIFVTVAELYENIPRIISPNEPDKVVFSENPIEVKHRAIHILDELLKCFAWWSIQRGQDYYNAWIDTDNFFKMNYVPVIFLSVYHAILEEDRFAVIKLEDLLFPLRKHGQVSSLKEVKKLNRHFIGILSVNSPYKQKISIVMPVSCIQNFVMNLLHAGKLTEDETNDLWLEAKHILDMYYLKRKDISDQFFKLCFDFKLPNSTLEDRSKWGLIESNVILVSSVCLLVTIQKLFPDRYSTFYNMIRKLGKTVKPEVDLLISCVSRYIFM